MKKRLFLLIVSVCLISALCFAAGCGTIFSGEGDVKEVIASDPFQNSRPDREPTFTSEEMQKIDLALSPVATGAQIREAIAVMYARANANMIHNADRAMTVFRGQESNSMLFVGQNVSYMSGRYGYRLQVDDEITFKEVSKLESCNTASLTSVLEHICNRQELGYTNMDDTYLLSGVLRGWDARIDGANGPSYFFPFISTGAPRDLFAYGDCEDYIAMGYYREDPREITNLKIVKDYIVLDGDRLNIGERFIEYDAEQGYYTLRFSLTTDADCVGVARSKDKSEYGAEFLDYSCLDLVLEIWDNGYLKRIGDTRYWSGTIEGGEESGVKAQENIVFYGFEQKFFSEEILDMFSGWNYEYDEHGNKVYEIEDGLQTLMQVCLTEITTVCRIIG